MDDFLKLKLLKQDLQMLSDSSDEYLSSLLSLSKMEMEREGIKFGDDDEADGLNIQYAAYLFRKRAGNETGMPRYLRFALNNLILHQRGKENGGTI